MCLKEGTYGTVNFEAHLFVICSYIRKVLKVNIWKVYVN